MNPFSPDATRTPIPPEPKPWEKPDGFLVWAIETWGEPATEEAKAFYYKHGYSGQVVVGYRPPSS